MTDLLVPWWLPGACVITGSCLVWGFEFGSYLVRRRRQRRQQQLAWAYLIAARDQLRRGQQPKEWMN